MKYIEDYLAERMKIKVLGELRTIDEEAEPCMMVGQRLVIDDMKSDIVVWYADYCMWLEKKFEELQNSWQGKANNHISSSGMWSLFHCRLAELYL